MGVGYFRGGLLFAIRRLPTVRQQGDGPEVGWGKDPAREEGMAFVIILEELWEDQSCWQNSSVPSMGKFQYAKMYSSVPIMRMAKSKNQYCTPTRAETSPPVNSR